MTNVRKEFGKKLIEIREVKGLRQDSIADLINLNKRTTTTVYRIFPKTVVF